MVPVEDGSNAQKADPSKGPAKKSGGCCTSCWAKCGSCCKSCFSKCFNACSTFLYSIINFMSKLMYCDVVLRNSAMAEAGCGAIANWTRYSAAHKELSGAIERTTAIGVVAISIFSMWIMDLLVNTVSEYKESLVETYIPLFMSLWLGLYVAKLFTYP